jgi:hypothetical protein
MFKHHPVIDGWTLQHARARAASRRDDGPHVEPLNNLDHRQHRILSRIFFGVEPHGVVPISPGYPWFHFEYHGAPVQCSIGPVRTRILGSDKWKTNLHFVIYEQPNRIIRQFSDELAPLEEQIPEIVAAILIEARSVARARREAAKTALEEQVAQLLVQIEQLAEDSLDDTAVVLDPRAFENLLQMAERHRSAQLVRHFLRAVTRSTHDGSAMVVGRTMDDWVAWANAKADEFDPLARGSEYVFDKLMRG